MRKVVLTFGLIAGGILSASMLLALPFRDQIGFDRAVVVGYTTMVLAFLAVFFGVRSYRDHVAGGTITFGKAFQVGLLIVAVATVCYVATWEFVYFKLAPDYGDAYAEHLVNKERKAGATEERLAALTREMADFREEYKKPLVNIAYTTLEPLPVGLLFTLIAAGVHSRRRSRTHA